MIEYLHSQVNVLSSLTGPYCSQALVLTVLITGVFNRVFYKMALQPLGNYVFFLAQFQTFSYVFVYFAVLLARRR